MIKKTNRFYSFRFQMLNRLKKIEELSRSQDMFNANGIYSSSIFFKHFIARKSSYRCAIASALISHAFRTHVSILRYSNEYFHTFRRNLRTIIPLLSDHEYHKCIGRDQNVLLAASHRSTHHDYVLAYNVTLIIIVM